MSCCRTLSLSLSLSQLITLFLLFFTGIWGVQTPTHTHTHTHKPAGQQVSRGTHHLELWGSEVTERIRTRLPPSKDTGESSQQPSTLKPELQLLSNTFTLVRTRCRRGPKRRAVFFNFESPDSIIIDVLPRARALSFSTRARSPRPSSPSLAPPQLQNAWSNLFDSSVWADKTQGGHLCNLYFNSFVRASSFFLGTL